MQADPIYHSQRQAATPTVKYGQLKTSKTFYQLRVEVSNKAEVLLVTGDKKAQTH